MHKELLNQKLLSTEVQRF